MKNILNISVLTAVTLTLVLFLFRYIINKETDLDLALQLAGQNQSELETVINHYAQIDPNEEKLNAAKFLISNCCIHFSNKSEIYDRITNDTIHIDPLIYPDGILAGRAKDSIIRNSKVIRNTKFDVQVVSGGFRWFHIVSCCFRWLLSGYRTVTER